MIDEKLNAVDYLVFTLFILLCEGSAFFIAEDWFTISVFTCLSIIFLLKGNKVDIGFIFLIGVWFVINLFSEIINGHLNKSTFIGYTIKICIPYLMVKIVGCHFFNKLFKFAFFLVITSSIFYIIEVIFPTFVKSLIPYLNFLERWRMLAHGDFYIFFYNHLEANQTYYGIFPRNSGFMWEPGAYALFLSLLIALHINKTDYKIDWKLCFLIIAMISTFSTSGYLTLFVFSILFIINNENLRRNYIFAILFLLIDIVLILYTFDSAEFLSEKINNYIVQGDSVGNQYFENESWKRVSRLGFAQISLDNSFIHPWGDGINLSNYILINYGNISSANSLASLLVQWGWFGFIYFLYSLAKLNPNNKKMGWLLLGTLPIPLFSNPFSTMRYLIFALFFFSIICNNFECSKTEDKNLSL